jgi:hypothetical protein
MRGARYVGLIPWTLRSGSEQLGPMKGFSKADGLTDIRKFLLKFSSGFSKLVNMGTTGFWKLFYGCTCSFQVK